MSTTHTPGPWKLVQATKHPTNEGEQIAFIQSSKTCFDFSSVHTDQMPREEFKANADLIAAAPDLLFALQEITAHLDSIKKYSNDDYYINQAQQAINKALNQ